MGYSCTAKAGLVLEAISKLFCTESSNSFRLEDGKDAFFETGREQRDGAVTGSIMKMESLSSCRTMGTFRISPEGRIERFPGLSAAQKRQAERLAEDRYLALYDTYYGVTLN